MKNTQIKDRTVKEIFDSLLGEKNAEVFLSKVQAEYDRGVRGEELENFSRDAISEFRILEPGSIKCPVGVAVIAVAVAM